MNIRSGIASIGYVETEMKWLITHKANAANYQKGVQD